MGSLPSARTPEMKSGLEIHRTGLPDTIEARDLIRVIVSKA